MNPNRASPDPRRGTERILDTAEGVLIALRRYDLTHAFIDLAETAQQYGLTPMRLADALVALAQSRHTEDCDQRAVDIARLRWGSLLDRNRHSPIAPLVNRLHPGHERVPWRKEPNLLDDRGFPDQRTADGEPPEVLD
jgi:hypothetical protein